MEAMCKDIDSCPEKFNRRETDLIFDKRLDNIESELRQMREVLVTLARVDERMANYASSNVRIEAEIASLTLRLNAIDTATALNKKSLGVFERGGWIILTTVVGFVAAFFSRRMA